MISRTDRPVRPFPRRIAVRAALLAVFAGALWLSPVSAKEKTAPNDAGLSDLTIWQGPAFGTGTADFGSGVEKGLGSLGNALKKAFTPHLGDRLALTPPVPRRRRILFGDDRLPHDGNFGGGLAKGSWRGHHDDRPRARRCSPEDGPTV